MLSIEFQSMGFQSGKLHSMIMKVTFFRDHVNCNGFDGIFNKCR